MLSGCLRSPPSKSYGPCAQGREASSLRHHFNGYRVTAVKLRADARVVAGPAVPAADISRSIRVGPFGTLRQMSRGRDMPVVELLKRYRSNYAIPTSRPLTEAEVRRHLDLERALTRELLASSPETRWETFERCYSRLYAELPWLNAGEPTRHVLDDWPTLIGPPPRRVYEVGSGSGALARALAAEGYGVVATEVTRERGAAREDDERLRWGATDGVHLDQFAEAGSFDAVISDQVVEHLHPDDLREHLRGAFALLRPGGAYILRTPHAFVGPSDVSRVFGFNRPVGMHLKEYTYTDVAVAAAAAGFGPLAAPFGLPGPLRRPLGLGVRVSRRYLRYLIEIERWVSCLPPAWRRRLRPFLVPPLFRHDVTLAAVRPGARERAPDVG